MNQLRLVPAVFAASAVFLSTPFASALVAPPSDPVASECATNAECGRGYECTVVAESGCASSGCAPGASCPPPEPCQVTETRACTPAHCGVDADCADGMVCHQYVDSGNVADCACAPGSMCNCGGGTPAKTVSMCTPRYWLPCKTASDCGEGFNCEQHNDCNCPTSGAAPRPEPLPDGAAGAPADPIDPMPEPICDCGPPETICVAKEVACKTDAQCLPGWTCQSEDIATAPACAGPDCPPAQKPAPARSLCRPPYYGSHLGGDVDQPVVPVSGSGGGTTTSGGKGTGTRVPESNQADDGKAHESSACQFGRSPASRGAVSMAALLGALIGLSRRRRSRS